MIFGPQSGLPDFLISESTIFQKPLPDTLPALFSVKPGKCAVREFGTLPIPVSRIFTGRSDAQFQLGAA
jgi:hypothetical protein